METKQASEQELLDDAKKKLQLLCRRYGQRVEGGGITQRLAGICLAIILGVDEKLHAAALAFLNVLIKFLESEEAFLSNSDNVNNIELTRELEGLQVFLERFRSLREFLELKSTPS